MVRRIFVPYAPRVANTEAGTNLQIALREKKDTAGVEAVRRSQEFCVFR